jgi:hypothetical protein
MKKRMRKKLRSKANGTNNYLMKAYMVKKTTM